MKKKVLSHLFAEKSPGQLGQLWVYCDQQKPLYYERKKKQTNKTKQNIYTQLFPLQLLITLKKCPNT